MVANGIDRLLLEFANLPWVLEHAIFSGALFTLARKVGADFLGHFLGKDFDRLHIRLVEEKHAHIGDIALGGISGPP